MKIMDDTMVVLLKSEKFVELISKSIILIQKRSIQSFAMIHFNSFIHLVLNIIHTLDSSGKTVKKFVSFQNRMA